MISPRSIEEIQNAILAGIVRESAIADTSQGSVIKAITRSIASALSLQDLLLYETISNFYLPTASGKSLDDRASDFGINRKPGKFSTGSVLAIGNEGNTTLDKNSVLTEPVTSTQFKIIAEDNLTISEFAETKFSIEALSKGSIGNFKAGTRLISPIYPKVRFIAGTHRTSSGEICGDLSGGVDEETDEQLRSRVLNYIFSSRGTTEESIENILLSQTSIDWVSIVIPIPGQIQAWVDANHTLSAIELSTLKSIADKVKPAGSILSVYQANKKFIDINLRVKSNLNGDVKKLTETITSAVKNYMLTLGLGQSFNRTNLINTISKINSVYNVEVTSPNTDVTSNSEEILRQKTILITYETS